MHLLWSHGVAYTPCSYATQACACFSFLALFACVSGRGRRGGCVDEWGLGDKGDWLVYRLYDGRSPGFDFESGHELLGDPHTSGHYSLARVLSEHAFMCKGWIC